jgi:hypothetical protein
VHDRGTVAEVLHLVRDLGLNHCEVSRRTGVPRPTVRDWANGKLPHSFERRRGLSGRSTGPGVCERCGADRHDFARLSSSYVYLLGLYLGDGTISKHRRGVYKLRIFLDKRYPNVVGECEAAMKAVLPFNTVNKFLTVSNCFEVFSYSKAWPCLIPQSGPGAKHTRPIELALWQREWVDLIPELFLRGLVHSDGCRFINTGRGRWRYPRYAFSNASSEIRQLFCDACDQLSLQWTLAPRTVYVSRKADVDRMDDFIGPKR